jgi:BirA family biotin operon repressor/biotin-[acetyl-CoA-carboxylase] ligase
LGDFFPPDGPLTEARIEAALRTRWLGRRAQCHAVCDSTNDLASQAAREGAPSGLLVIAEEQRRGRGRQGRTWVAPAGSSLTFSLLARFERPTPELPRVTLAAGVAVAEALAELGLEGALKWPNDVLIPGACTPGAGRLGEDNGWRKVAGILAEMTASDVSAPRGCHVILGIGLNVNTEIFPPELATRATSMRAARAGGEPWDRAQVLATLLGHLETVLETFERDGLAPLRRRWETNMATGVPYRAETDHGLVVEGWQHGLDEDGALLLRDSEDRLHRVLSGELEVAGFSTRG